MLQDLGVVEHMKESIASSCSGPLEWRTATFQLKKQYCSSHLGSTMVKQISQIPVGQLSSSGITELWLQ